MNSLTKETKLTLVYIFVAFTFSVLMRMIWVYQFEGYEAFKYAGEFMINTNDGYYWAEGTRDMLVGSHQLHDLSPIGEAISNLTLFFVKILPFSFETIIFYMPAYMGSLIVVPIILIAKDLKNLEMGFIAALLASIAWSYYNRTMVGYYDNDMLNIVMPMFLLWSVIWAIDTKKDIFLIITAMDILLYRWWYPQSHSLEFSFFGLILLYTLIFERKNLYNYKLLTLMLLAIMNFNVYFKIVIISAVFYIFKQEKFNKKVLVLFSISIVMFLLAGNLNSMLGQITDYIIKDTTKVTLDGLGLHFFSVMQTVREAGHIPFETFANRISGHTITFVISTIGYLYLVYRHKVMIFALPLVGLGFLASVGGLRFTVYAVPILAMGIAFLIIEISSKMPTNKLKYISMVIFTLAILFPNYKHIEGYRVPTVFNSDEVAILDKLKSKADREDYVVAWWDYGYPIRYYSDVKTLTDGGKHSGSVNFPVSYILTHSQKESAKMARLDVEYTEKGFLIADKNKELDTDEKIKFKSYIEEMTKDHGFQDTNDFLLSLQTDIELPKKTRDIYFYLPFKMLNIYPTVAIFSNIDLMTGKRKPSPFFYKTNYFKDKGATLDLGGNIYIDKAKNSLFIRGKQVPIKRFVRSKYNEKMELKNNIQNFDTNYGLSIIYMSSYKMFLIVDEKTYNSLYIQLMVLEQYDKNLFEKIVANPYAKVYKLKI